MKKTQSQYSFGLASNRKMFRKGMTEGIPIAMGYLAVSFSLGIMAKRAGLSPFAAFLASFFNNASAGEYAAFSLIMVEASYVEVAIMTFIANARYLLMSIALSQKIKPEASIGHRFLVAFDITDEIFALSVSQPGYLNPNYTYGIITLALPAWAFGTMLGCLAGSILPARIVSALSVALYGMFLAIIIPPAKKDKVVLGLIVISFASSYLARILPGDRIDLKWNEDHSFDAGDLCGRCDRISTQGGGRACVIISIFIYSSQHWFPMASACFPWCSCARRSKVPLSDPFYIMCLM